MEKFLKEKSKDFLTKMKIRKISQNLKERKKFLLFFLLFSVITTIPFKFVSAAPYDPILKGLLFFLITLVLGIIALFGIIVSSLCGVILQMMTEIIRWAATAKLGGLAMTKPEANPFIEAGLKVTMPLANMAFILAFVAIAIATILGIESYGLRKLLPWLIIMALLVNFAPVLVGIVVDAANVIINYFVKGIDFTKLVETSKDEIGNFIIAISKGFRGVFPAADYSPYLEWAITGTCSGKVGCNELEPGNDWKELDDNPGLMFPVLYIVGSSASMLIAIITLAMMVGMFLVRNLIIWLLVIFSPLAFAAYVLPATRNAFKQWWKQLLQWAFMGVSMCFFLYLATVLIYASDSITIGNETTNNATTQTAPQNQEPTAVSGINSKIKASVEETKNENNVRLAQNYQLASDDKNASNNSDKEINSSDIDLNDTNSQKSFLDKIMLMVIKVVFPVVVMVIGLFLSAKGGNSFAKAALGASAGVGAFLGAKTGSALKMAGAKTKLGGKRMVGKTRLGRGLESIGLAKPGTFTSAGTKETLEEEEKIEKEMKGMGPEQYRNLLNQTKFKSLKNPKNAAKARVAIKNLTEMGELKEEDRSIIERLDKLGHKKIAKDARKKLPTLVIDPKKTDTENQSALNKIFKEMTTEERGRVQQTTYKNVQATMASLRTAKDYKDFQATLSSHKNARTIGAQLMGLSKSALSAGTTFEDQIKRELGDQQGNFIMAQFGRADVQRKTGIRYDQGQRRFVKT